MSSASTTVTKHKEEVDVMIPEWQQKIIEKDGKTLKFYGKSYTGEFERNKVTNEHVKRLVDNNNIDFSKIIEVDLTYCSEITDQGIKRLVEKCGGSLKILSLYGVSKLTDDTLKAIATECKQLQKLNLRETNITSDGLRYIYAVKNELNLEDLDLIGCKNITDQGMFGIVETFKGLRRLIIGRCCQLTNESFRAIVDNCPNLTLLDVGYIGGITEIPQDIGDKLRDLETLFIGGNHITILPRSITNMTNLENFYVYPNPLQEPPLAVATQGIEAITRYLKELDKGADTSTKLKIVLLGSKEAGKTSLLQAIEGLPDPRTKKSERTIHVSLRTVKIEDTAKMVQNKKKNSNTKAVPSSLDLQFYDCGGQKEHISGQAPLLSESALIVLVVSAEEIESKDFLPFLVILQARVPHAVVQIILSKCDQVNDVKAKVKWLKGVIDMYMNQCSKSGQRKHTLLQVQPDIITIYVKEKKALGIFDRTNVNVQEKVLQKIIDIVSQSPPLIPTVGQTIPKSYCRLYNLIDLLRSHSIRNKSTVFEKLSSIEAQEGEGKIGKDNGDDENCSGCVGTPLVASAVRNFTCKVFGQNHSISQNDIFSAVQSNSNGDLIPDPYVKITELFHLWKEYYLGTQKNNNSDIDAFVRSFLKDALHLLEAQGEIFIYSGLVFLRPQFIIDLTAPLVNHLLTEKVLNKTPDLTTDVLDFLSNIDETDSYSALEESLERFVKTGALLGDKYSDLSQTNLLLRFLWRDLKQLNIEDFSIVAQMLNDCGIIFLSSFSDSKSQCPAVLYHLPIDPPDADLLDKQWPTKCPESKTHVEFRVQLPAGCPLCLSANTAASVHLLGHCSQAWQNGVLINMEDGTLIRVELVQGKTQNHDYLRFAIRAPNANGISASKHMSLLPYLYDFIKLEKENRLPGLVYYVVWVCPKCIERNNGKVQTFTWTPPLLLETMKHSCDFCCEDIDLMNIVDKLTLQSIHNLNTKPLKKKGLIKRLF